MRCLPEYSFLKHPPPCDGTWTTDSSSYSFVYFISNNSFLITLTWENDRSQGLDGTYKPIPLLTKVCITPYTEKWEKVAFSHPSAYVNWPSFRLILFDDHFFLSVFILVKRLHCFYFLDAIYIFWFFDILHNNEVYPMCIFVKHYNWYSNHQSLWNYFEFLDPT